VSEPTAAPSRRSPTVLLVIAIVILLGQIVREERLIQNLRTQSGLSQDEIDKRATEIANQRLQGHREDVVRAAQWLQDFYRSDDGLKRTDGLWNASQRQVDTEAIGAWIFDVYLKARIDGKSDDEARQAVAEAIRGTDEWRRVHGK
jgi:hypothetical protein